MSFQNRLKQAREMKKIDRKELAEKVGVTVSSISNYENGISVPKTEIMYKLLSVLEIDANFLFQDEIETANRVDRCYNIGLNMYEILKNRTYEMELDVKRAICSMVNALNLDDAAKVYDYVSVIFENMNYKDKDQISLFDDKKESQEDDSE